MNLNKQMIEMMGKVKNFKNNKFKIKNIEFVVSKLPPMKGFDMSEGIRVALAHTASTMDAGDGTEAQNAALFIKAILGLPAAFVAELRDELFEHVEFTGGAMDKGYAKLAGLEDTAFEKLEVISIYEVLARALFINFHESFPDMSSVFHSAGKDLSQQEPKT